MVIATSGASASTLTTHYSFDPEADLLNDGVLVKASNFGDGATAVTVNGISFDTDYSNTDLASPSQTSTYYGGSDPGVADLMNNQINLGRTASSGASTLTIALTGLTVGHNYRAQAIYGNDGSYPAIDMFILGEGDAWLEHQWIDIGTAGQTLLAVYEFEAATEAVTIGVNANWDLGETNHFDFMGYAVHNTTVPERAVLHPVPV